MPGADEAKEPRIDSVSQGVYGTLLTDLNEMFQSSFMALDMNWEGSIDPVPLLTETFNALANEDIEALKTYTVDGTLFICAFRKGIEMPTIENGDTVRHYWYLPYARLVRPEKYIISTDGEGRTNARHLKMEVEESVQ